MPDLLIPDLDEAVIAQLKAAAERRGLDLGRFVVEMLDLREAKEDTGVLRRDSRDARFATEARGRRRAGRQAPP